MSKQKITTINGVEIFAEETEIKNLDARLQNLAKERTGSQPDIFNGSY